MKINIKVLIKSVLIISIVLLSIIVFVYIDLEEIKEILSAYPTLSPIIYILLFSILPIFFFPVITLALAAGLIFKTVNGSIYTIIGAMINIILMYYITVFLGKDFVNKQINKIKNKKVRLWFSNPNQNFLFLIFFILRLAPVVSYNLINYISGISKISFWKYIISSFLGIIPGTILMVNAGENMTNILSFSFALPVILLLFLTIASIGILKIYIRKKNGNNNNTDI